MKWLPILMYVLVAPAIAGTIIIALLTMRDYSAELIAGGAIAGFLLGIPVAWVVTRRVKAAKG